MAVRFMLLLAMLVCSMTAYASECNTPWTDCGSTGVTIDSVSIPNCCTHAAPCTVVRGKSAKFTFSFTPKEDISTMSQSMCGVIESGICIPMSGFNTTNVCTYASPPCPFKSGQKETVIVSYPVPKMTVTDLITADWKLNDSTGKEVGCFSVVLKLVEDEQADFRSDRGASSS